MKIELYILTMFRNAKLVFSIYYLYNAASYILYFSKFILSINNIITLYIVDQSNTVVEN